MKSRSQIRKLQGEVIQHMRAAADEFFWETRDDPDMPSMVDAFCDALDLGAILLRDELETRARLEKMGFDQ